MAERRGFPGFLAARRLAWCYFWSRRAPWRIHLVQALLFIAALIVVYRLISAAWQSQVNQWLLGVVQFTASLSPDTLFFGLAGLFALVCLALIFVRPYRRATYLATTPSAIPPVSVYVDAENQLTNVADIPNFTDELVEHLKGRRADLLFLMDASSEEHGARTEQFKRLYRYGFRPVHVAHNPTGKAKKGIKEAVDKELAMHAYERALLGPPGQEFIIVTADQDFVALVYRLAALGHYVQVWATPILPAYRELATYLDIELNDLSHVVSESASSRQDDGGDGNDRNGSSGETTERTGGSSRQADSPSNGRPAYETAAPTLLSEAGEKQLYRAIAGTLAEHVKCVENRQGLAAFSKAIQRELGSRLASVGYKTAKKIDYWLDHLYAAGVLTKVKGNQLPEAGSATPEHAAHTLFIVAQLTADAAIAAARTRTDRAITMNDIANTLLPDQARARGRVRDLLDLILRTNEKRAAHALFFVRCAQALGLVEFDDVPNSPNAIRSPRVVEIPLADDANDADESEQPEAERTAGDVVDMGADAENPSTDTPINADTFTERDGTSENGLEPTA